MRAPEFEAKRGSALGCHRRDANGPLHPSHLELAHGANVTAIESVGDAENGGQSPNLIAERRIERVKVAVPFPRR